MRNAIAYFGIIFVLLHAGLTYSQNRSIRFEKTNWKQTLEKAKKEKKIIFLDCYTSWCGPCKAMEQTVFHNDTVADFYNGNFICMKMDMEKGEGFALVKKYNITAYPTMLYLNSAGDILHRSCGAVPARNFIETGQQALDPQTQFSTYVTLFNNGITTAKNAYTYFSFLENACQSCLPAVADYFSHQADSSLISYYNWQIIYSCADHASKQYQYMESNKEKFFKLYGRDSVERKINEVYAAALQQAHQNKNKKEFERLKNKLLGLKISNSENTIRHAELKLEATLTRDMKTAALIRDSIVGPVNVGKGFGTIREFNKGFISEDNSIWFKLEIELDTLLTFDLVPIDSLDDYDFAIYKTNDPAAKPIRICYSYCTSKSGITGLSRYVAETDIGAGNGPAYVAGIPVKKGETYYLIVNFAEGYVKQRKMPLGFTVYFYNYWPKRKAIILRSVFFENNRSVFSKKPVELDRLVALLKSNQMKIEVSGHTDNNGNEKSNVALSNARAKAVVDYLVSKGIDAGRLFYKGFGSAKPIDTNDTEEGRKKNRRVEFAVIMY